MIKRMFIAFLFLLPRTVQPQSDIHFSFIPSEKYTVIERSDYRIRVNGVYKGHVFNENRGIFRAEPLSDGSFRVMGHFYVFEELTRDGSRSASKVNEINKAEFRLFSSGEMVLDSMSTYPLLRSFPNYSADAMTKGDSWLAFSEKVVIRRGFVTKFPVYCQYVYEGLFPYNGERAHRIRAKYAVRYKWGDDPAGDEQLKNISGTHDVTIMISEETGAPLLIRDNMREIHTYTDGGSLEKNGFVLTFFKGVRGLDKAVLAHKIESALEENLGEDFRDEIAVSESEEGLLLTLKNLHFLPDQAVLLEEDVPLLDTLAGYLGTIGDRSFFVKGHTADVGTQESQFELSISRAEVVVRELVKRGIAEDRFLYMGLGGTEPLASNETEEGRAANRRVEIIILED